MRYSYIETEAADRKHFSKGEIKMNLVLGGHIFHLNPFQITVLGNVFMSSKNKCDQILNLETQVFLKFLSTTFLQNKVGCWFWKSFTRKLIQRNMEKESIKSEFYEDNCLLDQVSRTFYLFDFVAISSYVAVITFNSSKPIQLLNQLLKKGTSNQKL